MMYVLATHFTGSRFLRANHTTLFVQGVDGQPGRNGTDGNPGRAGKPGKQVCIDFMFQVAIATVYTAFVFSGTFRRPRGTWLPRCTRSKRIAREKREHNIQSLF